MADLNCFVDTTAYSLTPFMTLNEFNLKTVLYRVFKRVVHAIETEMSYEKYLLVIASVSRENRHAAKNVLAYSPRESVPGHCV